MSAQPTDEVFFSSAGRAFAPNQHNFTGCELPRSLSEPIAARRGDHRSPAWSELRFNKRIKDSADTSFASARPEDAEETVKKGRAMPAPTLWILVRIWFLEAERASPFPTGCRQSFCTKSAQFHGMRNAMVCSALSIPGRRNECIRSCVRAPLKSCVRGGGSALAEPVGLCFQISAASPHTTIIHYSLAGAVCAFRLPQ